MANASVRPTCAPSRHVLPAERNTAAVRSVRVTFTAVAVRPHKSIRIDRLRTRHQANRQRVRLYADSYQWPENSVCFLHIRNVLTIEGGASNHKNTLRVCLTHQFVYGMTVHKQEILFIAYLHSS